MAAPRDDYTPLTSAIDVTTVGSTNSDDDSPTLTSDRGNLEAEQLPLDPTCDPESIHNELAEDYVYTVKFTFTASRLDTIKKMVDVFIEKALNQIGVVFFKAQSYYRSYHGNCGENNDRGACLVEFHLFSIECLNQDVHKAMNELVSKYLNPPNEQKKTKKKNKLKKTRQNKLEDLHYDVLLRHTTQLRKPVYTYVYLAITVTS